MPMTEEERREKRNEASRRWYAAHKAKNQPDNPVKRGRPRKTDEKRIFNTSPINRLQRSVDRLISRNTKSVNGIQQMVVDAASLLTEVYRTGDPKFADKTVKALSRQLSLNVEKTADGKAEVSFTCFAKKFQVPKDSIEFAEQEPAQDENGSVEIPVDPSVLDGVPSDGSGLDEEAIAKARDRAYGDDDCDEDNDEDDDFGDENEDYDEDDEEDGRRRRRRMDLDEDYMQGRAEFMREFDSQGVDYE